MALEPGGFVEGLGQVVGLLEPLYAAVYPCSCQGLPDESIENWTVEGLVGNQTQAVEVVLAVVSVFGEIGRR